MRNDRILFLGCFIALVATAFGFIVRAMLMPGQWAHAESEGGFGLTASQQGEIFGVGLWPFAISIVLFSLFIDKVGYGRAMVFAFVCHVASVVMTIFAESYTALYAATFVVALGNGTVEAVINPVIATQFKHEKTKWLNILHAGWPGGLVLGGLLAIALGDVAWEWKVGLLLLPTVIYGGLLIQCKFPVQERVAAGVSTREMLRQTGGAGMFIVALLIMLELGRVFGWAEYISLIIAAIVAGGFGVAVQGIGRPMFVFLLLIMIPLATTELGVDSWITPLMENEMKALDLEPVWVLVYTSAIMMVLRLFCGPIVHRISPLGLLATSSIIAAGGLFFLSSATGKMIFLAATLYGIGKTFFWPTMLGVVAERFPKGGALTLNATGGVGMLGVGIFGNQFLGWLQDTRATDRLQSDHEVLASKVVTEKVGLFGDYSAVDPNMKASLPPADQATVDGVIASVQKSALSTTAVLPLIMLACYIGLILYFKARGGYKAEVLVGHAAEDEKFTGGTEGPGEG